MTRNHGSQQPGFQGDANRGSRIAGPQLGQNLGAMAFHRARTDAKPLTINVIGQQWLWNFQYPEDGGITSNDLVLPKDRPVIFNVTSTDVIHSFWIPEMGIKIDANPRVTTTTLTTPDTLGVFNVRCAELCGLNHSYMETSGRVVAPADFDQWVKDQGGSPGMLVPLDVNKIEPKE